MMMHPEEPTIDLPSSGPDERAAVQPVDALPSHTSDDASQAPTSSVMLGAAEAALPGRAQESSNGLPPGTTIGRYTIERPLGEGGMGVVHIARQQSPNRRVALKLVRPGFATDRVLRRFEHEAEMLGRLQHPGIAQVYEAGIVQQQGTAIPFFAMELIEGRTLLRYADEKHLSVRARLQLLAAVCDAVQHAHQKGVIHRDLKPANILVDQHGQPKVLDFGVARAVDSRARDVTMQTNIGELVGTVPYMSPEQTLGDPDNIDTRSDVYALGVIGYQLLGGILPYPLQNATIHEAVRLIQMQSPARLGSLQRALRGDVETIIARALEKQPARRYQAAGDLAADLRRHLNNEPIEARPASVAYQLSRFALRHRLLVGAAAMVLVTLIGGIATASVLAVREAQARELAERAQLDLTAALAAEEQQRIEAQRQATIASTVNEFLRSDLLGSANPENVQDRELTVREAVDHAAATVGERFADEPEIEAAIRSTIGTVYDALGRFEAALEQFTLAHERFVAVGGDDHAEAAQAENRIAVQLRSLGRYDEALSLFRISVERHQRVFGIDHEDTLRATHNYALLLDDLGRSEEALQLFAQQYDMFVQRLGPDHTDTLTAMSSLAQVHLSLGNFTEAEPLLLNLLEARRTLLGEHHPRTLVVKNNLAIMYMNGMQDYARALPLLEEVVTARIELLGEGHVSTLIAMDNLGVLLRNLERYDESVTLYQRIIAAAEASLGPEHPDTLWAYYNLGLCYETMESDAAAEPWYERALQGRLAVLPAGHRLIERAMHKLVTVRIRQQLFAEAEPAALQWHAWCHEHLGPEDPRTQRAAETISSLYDQWGRPDQAAAWKKREDG